MPLGEGPGLEEIGHFVVDQRHAVAPPEKDHRAERESEDEEQHPDQDVEPPGHYEIHLSRRMMPIGAARLCAETAVREPISDWLAR